MEITIHKAKSQLSKLIKMAIDGEEVIISKGKSPLVKLQVLPGIKPTRRLGGAKGIIKYMSEGFNNELDDFKEYSI